MSEGESEQVKGGGVSEGESEQVKGGGVRVRVSK